MNRKASPDALPKRAVELRVSEVVEDRGSGEKVSGEKAVRWHKLHSARSGFWVSFPDVCG